MSKLRILSCTRCGHEWPTRKDSDPKVCPNCKNPNWNKEKKAK
jgi:rubrerythrin